ncbi:MAG: peptidylprolyl isomerase [Verrucomicrobiales bacterium]
MSKLTLFAALSVACATLTIQGADSLFGDRVIAEGRNVEVKQSELDEALTTFKGTRAAAGQPVPPQSTPQITGQILDKLIATDIFLSRATPEDKTTGTQEGEKFLKETMSSSPSEEAFKRRLLAQGTNLEEFRKQVIEQYIVKTVIDRELSSEIQVSEAEIKNFYEKNIASFTEPEKARVAHVLLGVRDFTTRKELSPADKKKKREIAEKVAERAKRGEDFTKLVKEFTDDAESKPKNGEYIVVKGLSRIPVEFESAAFSLKVGQISDVVASPFGFHVIKLLEKFPGKTTSLAEVQEKIKETLFQQEAQKLVQGHVKKLREEYQVKVNWP